jgi:ABC-type branched-subunit amino acid transport system ATPase component
MPILEANGVSSGYGEVEIVHDMDLFLEEGELLTIVGPNGAGKSTLIKTLFGILKPMRGSILYRGKDITGADPTKLVSMGISYVPQMDNVFPSLTVRENLEMGAYIRKDDFSGRMEEVLEMFPNLRERVDVKARKLSGGERQMLALGKTLMLDPEVMLIDEPSAGLAPVLVEAILDKIKEINEAGTSIIVVEQNARKALQMAHRGIVMDMGKKRFEDKGVALLNNPEVGRSYLGG